MKTLPIEHLTGIQELSAEDIKLVFDTADNFKEVLNRPIKKVPTLRDTTIANVFFESSTRTRLSFELAEKRLSAEVINFSSSASSVSKGETLLDTVNNILAMRVDMVVIRHPHVGAAQFLAKNTSATLLNAGDGTHEHPTQALLDAYSLYKKHGDLKGLKVALIGDILHSRVALSNILCLKKLGAEVTVCGPPTLIPRHIEKHLNIGVEHDINKALQWCDVANVLRIQLERQKSRHFPSLREYANLYGVTADRVNNLNKTLTIMHPGPINRGVEIESAVADSDHSLILDQVENGVAIRMAALYLLAGAHKKEEEAGS